MSKDTSIPTNLIKEEDWPEIAKSSEGLDGSDPLAIAIWTATYAELSRQYEAQKSA